MNMMKWCLRVLSVLLVMFLISPITEASAAKLTTAKVVIDGENQVYSQPAVVKNGATLVPLRGIFEVLGATVNWDNKTQSVTANKKSKTIKLTIGKSVATVNGQSVKLTAQAQIINGSTMVPLRFVSEALGANVDWKGETSTVIIVSEEAKQGKLIKDVQFNGNQLFILYSDATLWAMGQGFEEKPGYYNYSTKQPIKIADNVLKFDAKNDTYLFHIIHKNGDLMKWEITSKSPLFKKQKIAENVKYYEKIGRTQFIIKTDNSLWGWGNNTKNIFLNSGVKTVEQPMKILTNVESIVQVGDDYVPHLILKTDKTLWGWGENDYGDLLNGSTEAQAQPVKLLNNVVKVIGYTTKYALLKDGTLLGWGNNRFGQLGDGTMQTTYRPKAILTNVKDIHSDGKAALKNDGTLWTWGGHYANSDAEKNNLKPRQLTANVSKMIDSGGGLIILKTDQTLWGIGSNSYGQLANGTTEEVTVLHKMASNVKYASSATATVVVKNDQSIQVAGRALLEDFNGDFVNFVQVVPLK